MSNQEITIKVLKATVIRQRYGTDVINLQLDLPEGCYPFEGKAVVKMNVAKDTGVNYLKNNLGIQKVQVIEAV